MIVLDDFPINKRDSELFKEIVTLSKSQQLRSLHQSLKRPEAAGRSIALPSGN